MFKLTNNSKILLQADNGKYLARCNQCTGDSVAAYPNNAFVHVDIAPGATPPAPAVWTVITVNDKFALRSDIGLYLARCNQCIKGEAYPDNAAVHVTEEELQNAPFAQFVIESTRDGRLLFKADTGNYLARCQECIPNASYPNSAFFHVPPADLPKAPFAKWKPVEISS